jgi:hypothetical protein
MAPPVKPSTVGKYIPVLIGRLETLDYALSMASELQKLTVRHQIKIVPYLLHMVALEIKNQLDAAENARAEPVLPNHPIEHRQADHHRHQNQGVADAAEGRLVRDAEQARADEQAERVDRPDDEAQL